MRRTPSARSASPCSRSVNEDRADKWEDEWRSLLLDRLRAHEQRFTGLERDIRASGKGIRALIERNRVTLEGYGRKLTELETRSKVQAAVWALLASGVMSTLVGVVVYWVTTQ